MARTRRAIESDLERVRRQKLLPQSVAFADRSETNRSIADLERLESSLVRELQALERRPRQTVIVPHKGL
jgi:hypothetical protein